MTTGLLLLVDDVDVSCHAYAPLTAAWGRDKPGDSFEPRRLLVSLDDTVPIRRGSAVVAQANAPASNPTWADVVGTWAQQTKTWAGLRAFS